MNKEEVIKLAREVGFDDYEQDEMLTRFAALVAAAERKPMTDEEIDEAWKTSEGWRGFARAIEQAHGIKGEA